MPFFVIRKQGRTQEGAAGLQPPAPKHPKTEINLLKPSGNFTYQQV
jgi:hypothetical protein